MEGLSGLNLLLSRLLLRLLLGRKMSIAHNAGPDRKSNSGDLADSAIHLGCSCQCLTTHTSQSSVPVSTNSQHTICRDIQFLRMVRATDIVKLTHMTEWL